MPYCLLQCIYVGAPWLVESAAFVLKAIETITEREFVFQIVNGWVMPL